MIEAIRDVIDGDAPVFLLVAGPNGAGKSTYRVRRIEPLDFLCIDPDLVGMEMYGRHPATRAEGVAATIEATRRVQQYFDEGRSIGLETVFSDTEGHKLGLLAAAQSAGFRTILVFIGVNDPQISIARVMQRVEDGGHDVPDEIIAARFPKCFDNLRVALRQADLVWLVDNSGVRGMEGEGLEGLRHYEFAVIRDGKIVHLAESVPYWFDAFGIREALHGESGAS